VRCAASIGGVRVARARPTVRAVGASARGVGDRTARDARRRANERGKKSSNS